MAKRSRSNYESSLKKGQLAGARFNKLHPWSTWGAARIPRGSPMSLNLFGPSYKLADDRQKSFRKASGFSGRGKYSFGKFIRQSEGYADRFLKKGLPNILNAAKSAKTLVESIAGRGIYTGRGAYSGRGGYNSLIEGGDRSMSYASANDETESVVISNCEFINDVYGAPSAAFYNESYPLNPGLLEQFPWLSQVAQNYEEYEFIQCLFHYKSTVDASAINNTNGSTGTLIMATNYNPTADRFTNKETMMQYHGANTGRLVEDHTHGVECDPSKNSGTAQKYIRSLPVPPGQDPKTFDLGLFQIAQTNIPSAFQNQQIGELWVTYTVKLMKPKLSVSIGLAIPESRYVSSGAEQIAQPEGNGWLPNQANSIPIAIAATVSTALSTTATQSGTTVTLSSGTTTTNDIRPGDTVFLGIELHVISVSGSSTFVVNRSQTVATASALTSRRNTMAITFPDFLTGSFEIQLMFDCDANTGAGISATFAGSTSARNDMFGVFLGSGDLPSYCVAAGDHSQSLMIWHVDVQPIVAGADNIVSLRYTNTAGSPTLTQSYFTVKQCNPAIKNNYINSQGVVIAAPTF
ncbi:capsid protein [Crucivirus-402]|nr:capsid protein [Crucivirus-402]